MPALCPIFLMTRADFSSDDGSKPIEPADSTEWSFQAADAKQEQSKTFNISIVESFTATPFVGYPSVIPTIDKRLPLHSKT